MRIDRSPLVVWTALIVSLGLGGAGLVLEFLARGTRFPSGATSPSSFVSAMAGAFTACTLVGALILRRKPGHRIGWIFMGAGLSGALWGFSRPYAIYGLLTRPGSLPAARHLAWVERWAPFPAAVLLSVFLLLLFPDGRLQSRRWRVVAYAAVGGLALWLLGSLAPYRFEDFPVHNPVAVPGLQPLGDLAYLFLSVLPLLIMASAVGLFLRFRRSQSDGREQIKWLAVAAGLTALGQVAVNVFTSNDRPAAWTFAVVAASLASVPVAAGIAILKYRLYDIDVVINKTLVYAGLTGTLAGVYSGLVLGLGALARGVGENSNSPLVVAASTLVAAALFRPVRRTIQAFIDRRFYRRRYDARKTLDAFASSLRNETDLASLQTNLLDAVDQTVQPAATALWLRTETRS